MNKKGFTLIELIIVFVITGILILVAMPMFGRDLSRGDLKNNMYAIMNDLRSAQNKAMFGRNNTKWGVHLASNQFVFFRGAVYNPSDPNNQTTNLPATISLSWALNGGGADVVFNKIYADTAQYGTITLNEVSTTNTKIITINQVGMVDHN